ncbi:16S rRNA (guanine1207-N2)-methyltransferase [Acinetobacter calcoaceticus]|uniref:Ribosomal RNA small subunit methyltransferase C n=1 Tax=Acinetobacter calcoaceticus TaxID=471 RepID=A0A4V2R1D0_ACICA|nr:16S rRNA (guanine1207-N2)-methyltransferase [Acinetobacter calcoaceticus]
MDPRSEVVIRQSASLKGRVLFINAPADTLLHDLDDQIQSTHWTWNYYDHQAHLKQQYNSFFSVEFPAQEFDQVVIFTPKSKILLEYVLAQVASQLKPQQLVFLVGEKKGGIEGAAKQLQPYGSCFKLDSARHCQLWQMALSETVAAQPLQAWIKKYTIQAPDFSFEVCALPGVFSQDHLDIGTAELLPFLSQVKSGKIADFGCGAGVIACYLAKLNPANLIHALDIDAFALKSTELTFQHNQIAPEQLQLQAVTGIQDAPTDLNALVSNPPFHQGIQTNYDASEGLCRHAKSHLRPYGELWIVANRFLNYPQLIEQYFGRTTIKLDQNGFKVMHAQAFKRSKK